MQFTARVAINLSLDDDNLLGQLFAEELGAVVQVLPGYVFDFGELAQSMGVSQMVCDIGEVFATPAGGADQDILSIQTASMNLEFMRSDLQNE